MRIDDLSTRKRIHEFAGQLTVTKLVAHITRLLVAEGIGRA